MKKILLFAMLPFICMALPSRGFAAPFRYLTEDVQKNIKDEESLKATADKKTKEILENSRSSTDEKAQELEKLNEEKQKLKEQLDMFGFNFGIGLLGAHYHGRQRVESTQGINNRVVVEDGDNNLAGVVFETHNLRWNPLKSDAYIGPFLGVQTTQDELIDSIILGLMIGIAYKDDKTHSFNIGIGHTPEQP